LGIGLSDGVGNGLKVYGVITGLRTFPIVEKPPLARGDPKEVPDDAGSEVVVGPGNVDESHVDGDDTTLLAGGSTADEGKVELLALTEPRRVNKEHSVEKEDARNIDGEGSGREQQREYWT